MYVCMYTYIYIYICMYYVYVYVYMCVYIYIYIYIASEPRSDILQLLSMRVRVYTCQCI